MIAVTTKHSANSKVQGVATFCVESFAALPILDEGNTVYGRF